MYTATARGPSPNVFEFAIVNRTIRPLATPAWSDISGAAVNGREIMKLPSPRLPASVRMTLAPSVLAASPSRLASLSAALASFPPPWPPEFPLPAPPEPEAPDAGPPVPLPDPVDTVVPIAVPGMSGDSLDEPHAKATMAATKNPTRRALSISVPADGGGHDGVGRFEYLRVRLSEDRVGMTAMFVHCVELHRSFGVRMEARRPARMRRPRFGSIGAADLLAAHANVVDP